MTRLHLGCGSRYLGGAVNVDRFDLRVADLAADARRLPFRDGAFSEVLAFQLVEHLGYAGAIYAIAEWHRVLEPGGRLVVETPEPTGAFRRFLAAETDEAADRALGWIFGDEAPGYGHGYLYAPELLGRLAEAAGFEEIAFEEPTTYVTEPGTRLVCRATSSPLARALAATRARMAEVVLGLADPSEAAELEAELVARMRDAVAFGGPSPERAVEGALVIWSRATAWWLADAEAEGLEVGATVGSWPSVAAELARFELSGRLAAMIEPSTRLSAGSRAGLLHDELTEKGLEVVRRCRREGSPAPRAWLEVFGGPPPRPLGELFTASRVQRHAEGLLARALKAWVRGDREAAREGLLRASRAGPGRLYALWNLGRLAASMGLLEEAVSRLEEALPLATALEAGPLLGDLGLCLLDRGAREEALALLADPRVGARGPRLLEEGARAEDLGPLAPGELPRG